MSNLIMTRVNARGDDGRTALHLASANGHDEVVELLLRKGADVIARDNTNQTALYLAADNDHFEVVKILLRPERYDMTDLEIGNARLYHPYPIGHHTTRTTVWSEIPLTPSPHQLNDEFCCYLNAISKFNERLVLDVSFGSLINLQNLLRETPTIISEVVWDSSHLPMSVKSHISNLARIDGIALAHIPPILGSLKIALLPFWMTAVQGLSLSTLLAMIQRGLHILNRTDSEVCCVKYRKLIAVLVYDTVIWHLAKLANVNIQDHDGLTALHRASKHNNQKIARLLLESGANSRIQANGKTPLQIAVEQRSVETVELLLKSVEIGKETEEPWGLAERAGKEILRAFVHTDPLRALELAIEKRWQSTMELSLEEDVVIEHETKNKALIVAVEKNWSKALKLLLVKDVDVKGKTGELALDLTVEKGWGEMLKLLLEKNVDVRGGNGRRALEWIVDKTWNDINLRYDCLELLLKNGVDVTGGKGEKALILVAIAGKTELLKLLLKREVNLKGIAAEQALEWALTYGYDPIAELLLVNDVDPNTPQLRVPAITVAVNHERWESVHMLLKNGARVANEPYDDHQRLGDMVLQALCDARAEDVLPVTRNEIAWQLFKAGVSTEKLQGEEKMWLREVEEIIRKEQRSLTIRNPALQASGSDSASSSKTNQLCSPKV